MRRRRGWDWGNQCWNRHRGRRVGTHADNKKMSKIAHVYVATYCRDRLEDCGGGCGCKGTSLRSECTDSSSSSPSGWTARRGIRRVELPLYLIGPDLPSSKPSRRPYDRSSLYPQCLPSSWAIITILSPCSFLAFVLALAASAWASFF
jgi:hypothetical protein